MKTKPSRQMMREAPKMEERYRDHLLRRKKLATDPDGLMLPTPTRKIKINKRRWIVKLASGFFNILIKPG